MLLQECENQSLPLHLCITSALKNPLIAQVFMEIENNIKRHNSTGTSEEKQFFSIQSSVAKVAKGVLLHASGELISKTNTLKLRVNAKETKTPLKEKPAWAIFCASELFLQTIQ